MTAPAPIFRGQGTGLFRVDDAKRVIKRGQATPYDVNGAPTPTSEPGELEISIIDLPSAPSGVPLLRFRFNEDRTFSGGTGDAAIAATGSSVFDIRKNGLSVGSVTFAGSTGTVAFSDSSYPAGSLFELYPPVTADATLDQVSITLATA